MTVRRRTTLRRRRRWPRTVPSPMATLSSTTTTAKPTESAPDPRAATSCHRPGPSGRSTPGPGAPAGPRPCSGAGPQLCLTLTAGALPPLTCCLNPLRFPGQAGTPPGRLHPSGAVPSRPAAKELGPSPSPGSVLFQFSQPFLHRERGEIPPFPELEKPAQPLLHRTGREEQGIPGCFSA